MWHSGMIKPFHIDSYRENGLSLRTFRVRSSLTNYTSPSNPVTCMLAPLSPHSCPDHLQQLLISAATPYCISDDGKNTCYLFSCFTILMEFSKYTNTTQEILHYSPEIQKKTWQYTLPGYQ